MTPILGSACNSNTTSETATLHALAAGGVAGKHTRTRPRRIDLECWRRKGPPGLRGEAIRAFNREWYPRRLALSLSPLLTRKANGKARYCCRLLVARQRRSFVNARAITNSARLPSRFSLPPVRLPRRGDACENSPRSFFRRPLTRVRETRVNLGFPRS